MRFCSYNIQYGKGKDGVYDLERIAGEVAGADIIALQEVDRFWSRSGNVDQVEVLARALDGYHWVYGAGVDFDGSYRDADGRIVNRRRQFGNMLLSRLPIRMSRNHLLPKRGSIGPMSIQRSALESLIETDAGGILVYSLHLTHLSAETRLPQVQRLLDIIDSAPAEGAAVTGSASSDWCVDPLPDAELPRNVIALGDFNFMPGSPEYDRLVGPVCDYGGRIINPAGLVDAWVASGQAQDQGFTSDVEGVPARLDYAYVSTRLSGLIERVWVDEQAEGSDHQPLWMDIRL